MLFLEVYIWKYNVVSTEHSNTMLGITSLRIRTLHGQFMRETADFIAKHAMWVIWVKIAIFKLSG